MRTSLSYAWILTSTRETGDPGRPKQTLLPPRPILARPRFKRNALWSQLLATNTCPPGQPRSDCRDRHTCIWKSEKFHVSPELRAELVFCHPWLKKHHVIDKHAAVSIYLGTNTRQRIYLTPLPTPYEPTNYPIPELEHGFPPNFAPQNLLLHPSVLASSWLKTGWRLPIFLDYRRLNDQTDDTVRTLPRIHKILKDLVSTRLFTCLDLKSG